jgi:hypothetical protein
MSLKEHAHRFDIVKYEVLPRKKDMDSCFSQRFAATDPTPKMVSHATDNIGAHANNHRRGRGYAEHWYWR